MNSFLNNLSHQNNIENINKKVNQINLIQNDYYQLNRSKIFSNEQEKKVKRIYNDIPIKNNCFSKSFCQIDNINKNNISNYRKIFNHKNNINLNKKRIKQNSYQIKENEYIFNLAMNNLNKYKDNLVKENNSQISNQINNKKFTNNIINYCLINPNNNLNVQNSSDNNFKNNNEKNNNYLYNIENDILVNEKEANYPIPEPTPIKISKSSNNINQIKNASLFLRPNTQRNNSYNYLNNNYNKDFNSNNNNFNNINNNHNSPKYNNYLDNKNIKTDYYFGNYMNNYYNSSFYNESNKMNLNTERIKSSNIINNNNNNYNNDDDYKLIFILQNLNLSNFINVFKINYVSFNDLFFLTREDLLEMKIPIGPRNKILHFIQEYKKNMKSFEFKELSNFMSYYKNNNSLAIEQKNENYCSTTQTTDNELSNKIKKNQNNNNILFKEIIEDNLKEINYNDNNIFQYNKKENYNPNNSNYSLLDSSFQDIKTSIEKNNINIDKINSSPIRDANIRNLYINNNNHKNNSVFCKDRILNPYYNNENKTESDKNNKNIYKKIDIINKKLKKNIKKSRPNNNKNNLRNPLTKLIEDTQSTRTLSIINSQIMNQNNSSITNNNHKDLNKYENNHKIKNNKENKAKKLDKKNNKFLKRSKSIISNIKMKNNSMYRKDDSINLKIIENFKNLSNEVENFQNHYKQLKKASFDRENKIKSLLLEDRHSSRKLKILKEQIKYLDKNNSYNINIENNLELNDKKKINKNLVLKNICQNKSKSNINLKSNNNVFNKKDNTLIYELDIENVK